MLPTPTERSTLKITGLYRLVRHPIFTGLLAIVLGTALGSGRTVKMLLALALLGLLSAKARWEEDTLRRRYPDYDDFAAHTPRFLRRPVHRASRAAPEVQVRQVDSWAGLREEGRSGVRVEGSGGRR